jgi:maltooligosyltrehalose trehalohydrolase
MSGESPISRSTPGRSIALGATQQLDGVWDFSVWAPNRQTVALHILGTHSRAIPLAKDECGYHHARISDVEPGSRYLYRLDNSQEYPDPASRFQPEGVHKPSAVVDLMAFQWTDPKWTAPALADSIFYELHVGTFSDQGSLDGASEHLGELADLGVTTIELMPLAQFPGSRNWGYDGVYPFAVQNTYGGPLALQRFVNAAHEHGLAVAVDVVYNHLGPEGNYLSQFGPYFTERYKTPWGQALNFDGPQSGGVRRYFIENALYWFETFHIDVLRLDAIHGIYDFSALHVLAEMQEAVERLSKQLGRPLYLTAESNLNDARLLHPREKGGYAIPSQWSDDFHHSLHTLLTSETKGYYADFGSVSHLANTLRDGWYYHGQYSKSRKRRHGNSPLGLSRSHFVVFNQNHDQVGNRAQGDRLSTLVDFEAQKLAAGVTLLSPFVPLLFMGEEYGEPSPFLYFTSHSDRDLIEAVRRGRHEEFAAFGWHADVPDPQEETTFANSKLHREISRGDPHRRLRLFYRDLISFRQKYHLGSEADWKVTENENLKTLTVIRNSSQARVAIVFNFGASHISLPSALPIGDWSAEIESGAPKWLGPGRTPQQGATPGAAVVLSRQSFVVFREQGSDEKSRQGAPSQPRGGVST